MPCHSERPLLIDAKIMSWQHQALKKERRLYSGENVVRMRRSSILMGIQSVLANSINTHKEPCKNLWISMMMCQAKPDHGW